MVDSIDMLVIYPFVLYQLLILPHIQSMKARYNIYKVLLELIVLVMLLQLQNLTQLLLVIGKVFDGLLFSS